MTISCSFSAAVARWAATQRSTSSCTSTEPGWAAFPVPSWVVVSAGTGGTSSTIGRYIRYRRGLLGTTRLCVVDPENSVFFDFFCTGDKDLRAERGSRIEGIGRPRVEPSFLPSVIDRMMRIPDAASIATVWWLESVVGRRCGGSTGTNLFGAISIVAEMLSNGDQGR